MNTLKRKLKLVTLYHDRGKTRFYGHTVLATVLETSVIAGRSVENWDISGRYLVMRGKS